MRERKVKNRRRQWFVIHGALQNRGEWARGPIVASAFIRAEAPNTSINVLGLALQSRDSAEIPTAQPALCSGSGLAPLQRPMVETLIQLAHAATALTSLANRTVQIPTDLLLRWHIPSPHRIGHLSELLDQLIARNVALSGIRQHLYRVFYCKQLVAPAQHKASKQDRIPGRSAIGKNSGCNDRQLKYFLESCSRSQPQKDRHCPFLVLLQWLRPVDYRVEEGHQRAHLVTVLRWVQGD